METEHHEQYVINEWLLQMAYHFAWAEYSENGTIDEYNARDLIQGAISRPLGPSETSKQLVPLVVLLCRLADGDEPALNYEQEDAMSDEGTVMEQAVTLLDELIKCFEGGDDIFRLETMKICMKRQAVFACCRRGKFEDAWRVFQNLWPKSAKKNRFLRSTWYQKLRKKIGEVIESENMEHPLLESHPFSEVWKSSVETLGELHSRIPKPFLCQLAETMIKRRTASAGSVDSVQTPITLNTISEFTGAALERLLEMNNKENLKGRSLHIGKRKHAAFNCKLTNRHTQKAKYLHNMPASIKDFVLQPSASEEMENTGQDTTDTFGELLECADEQSLGHSQSQKQSTERGLKRHQNAITSPENKKSKRKRCNITGDSGSDDSSSPVPSPATLESSLGSRVGRANLLQTKALNTELPMSTSSISQNSGRGRKHMWTAVEEELVYRGVQRHGPGKWADVRSLAGFSDSRTNVDIKDKWRNMVKQQTRLAQLEQKFGKVQGYNFS